MRYGHYLCCHLTFVVNYNILHFAIDVLACFAKLRPQERAPYRATPKIKVVIRSRDCRVIASHFVCA